MAVKYATIFLTLLCTHLASAVPITPGCLDIDRTENSIECNCNYIPVTTFPVTWYRNGEIVTEVEGAVIQGNSITFHNQDPSIEAEWICEADGIQSPPKSYFSE